MTDVRSVNRRGWTVAITMAVVVLAGACGDDDGDAAPTTTDPPATTTDPPATTAPPRQTSTTTTGFDPASVEGQVEAAYLRSWDVYAEAVYNLELDEPALAEVYGGEGLANVTREIEGRIVERRAALVRVEHDYVVSATGPDAASVVDRLINHQVLIDPETKEPIEADPNEEQVLNFAMNRVDGRWLVVLIQELT